MILGRDILRRRSGRGLALCFFACAVLLGGCTRAPAVPESNRAMAARLEALAAETDAAPRKNAHANAARVRALRAVTPPRGREWIGYAFTLGNELLRAGEDEAAIAQFEALRDTMALHPDAFTEADRLAVLDHLALSFMRLGETENCLVNPSAERCLFPIRGAGVHTRTRGSREAARLYEAILAADPTDRNAQWLLNVAWMTLGHYPDSVGVAWRIPPEALAAAYDIGRFTDVAPALGLDVRGLSGGVVVEDLDGDGHLDVMASSWGLRDPLRLFLSDGAGGFTEQTTAAGLDGLTGGLNLVHADYDNDGDADVFVLRGAWLAEGFPNSLLRNDGGTFTDVTEAAGLLDAHPTQTAAWADYDGDGDLDLFVGNESNREAGRHPSTLFRNEGDGTFVDVAPAVGLDVVAYTKAAVWGDVDDDGRPDLFLSNYGGPNLLFRNDGPADDGRWRFTEVGAAAGVRAPLDSFPAWFFDYDNDGHLDLFVSGWRATAGDVAAEYLGLAHDAEPPRLYHNRGDGTFEDATDAAGLRRVLYTMGANFGDLDNDGFLDFYAGTGDPDFRALMPNRMFRNAGGRSFEDVTASGGFGHLQKGHAVAFADFDHDGDQDVYAVMGGAFEGDLAHNVLFENPGHGNHWLALRLEGTASNRSAIGARLRVDLDSADGPSSVFRTVGTGGSFGAASLGVAVGLGQARRIRGLEVRWPSGAVETFDDVPMDRAFRLREGDGRLEAVTRPPFVLGGGAAKAHTGH